MKKKTTLNAISQQIEKLGVGMRKGFASVEARMEKGFSAVADDLADVREDVSKLDFRISAVEKKVSGIYDILSQDARRERDQNVSHRVHDLEVRVFKTSKYPKELRV